MTYLAICAPLVLAAFALYLADRVYSRRERAAERREAAWMTERKELLDRMMYLADKPWEGPPQPPEIPWEMDTDVIDPMLEALP